MSTKTACYITQKWLPLPLSLYLPSFVFIFLPSFLFFFLSFCVCMCVTDRVSCYCATIPQPVTFPGRNHFLTNKIGSFPRGDDRSRISYFLNENTVEIFFYIPMIRYAENKQMLLKVKDFILKYIRRELLGEKNLWHS